MKEILEIYDLKGKHAGTKEREKFYSQARKEFKKTGKVSEQCAWVQLILMNSKGKIILQRRAKTKKENANLIDKTIGGHIRAGHSDTITMVRECAEELGIPSVVVSEDEFINAVKHTDLEVIAVLKEIELLNGYVSERQTSDESFQLPVRVTIYMGYYDGSIQFRDAEASGIQVFEVDELKKEIKDNPDKFTWDIKKMIKKYEPPNKL